MISLWFFFAFGSAVLQSILNALSNEAVRVGRFSKIGISFVITGTASVILIAASFIFLGIPVLKPGFWEAVFITGTLNIIMLPLGLKAYEIGEFSSVYSMSLAAPIFLLFTGWIFLGELPPRLGVLGVILSVIGLWAVGSSGKQYAKNIRRGNMYGLLVALMASITVNFDKITVLRSNQILAYGVIAGYMSLGYGLYLLLMRESLSLDNSEVKFFSLKSVSILLLAGIVQSLNGIFYNSALKLGFTSYTTAIKRMGVLFGVLWGTLFFKERQSFQKLFGVVTAIAGVILILLAK